MSEPIEYQRVISVLRDMPWAILPDKLEMIDRVLFERIENGRLTDEEIKVALGGDKPAKRRYKVEDGVAVVPVFGVIEKRMNLFTNMSGGTSTDMLAADLRQADQDVAVSGILLDMDSPGGSVFGPLHVAEVMARHRGRKPVYAVANETAASGAYWIAAAADRVYVSKTGVVGSIGVIATLREYSKAAEQAGITTTYLRAGKFKALGQPYEPLTKSAKETLQARVDHYYALFVESVAALRGMSVKAVAETEGATYVGQQAIDVGLADAIGSFDEAFADLKTRASSKVTVSLSSKGAAMADQPTVTATEPTPTAPPAATIPTPAVNPGPTAQEIQEQATARERSRAAAIRELFTTAKLDDPGLLASLLDTGASVEEARTQLFKQVCADRQPIGAGNGDAPATNDPDAAYRAEYEKHRAIHEENGVTLEQYLTTRKIDANGGVMPRTK